MYRMVIKWLFASYHSFISGYSNSITPCLSTSISWESITLIRHQVKDVQSSGIGIIMWNGSLLEETAVERVQIPEVLFWCVQRGAGRQSYRPLVGVGCSHSTDWDNAWQTWDHRNTYIIQQLHTLILVSPSAAKLLPVDGTPPLLLLTVCEAMSTREQDLNIPAGFILS